MTKYATLTDPAAEPLTVSEFKDLAREGSADYDASVIPLHLAEARETIVERTGRVAVNQTFRLTLPGFPDGDAIVIERVPLVSVESVGYYDLDDAAQTLAEGTDFRVITDTTPGAIRLLPNVLWPSAHPDREVTIDFTAGYGATAAGVPSKYKLAVAELAKERFNDWPVMSEKTRNLIDGLRWRVLHVA